MMSDPKICCFTIVIQLKTIHYSYMSDFSRISNFFTSKILKNTRALWGSSKMIEILGGRKKNGNIWQVGDLFFKKDMAMAS